MFLPPNVGVGLTWVVVRATKSVALSSSRIVSIENQLPHLVRLFAIQVPAVHH